MKDSVDIYGRPLCPVPGPREDMRSRPADDGRCKIV